MSRHAYHLYVVKLNKPKKLNKLDEPDKLNKPDQPDKRNRTKLFAELRTRKIGVNIHYIPIHYHPFYRDRFGNAKGQCPIAEMVYEQILSLPMFPSLSNEDVERVIFEFRKVIR